MDILSKPGRSIEESMDVLQDANLRDVDVFVLVRSDVLCVEGAIGEHWGGQINSDDWMRIPPLMYRITQLCRRKNHIMEYLLPSVKNVYMRNLHTLKKKKLDNFIPAMNENPQFTEKHMVEKSRGV